MTSDPLISILRCPSTKQRLQQTSPSTLTTEDASISYPIYDGIIDFLSPIHREPTDTAASLDNVVQEYYEGEGWVAGEDGAYDDSKRFMALDPVSRSYTEKCNLAVRTRLPYGGTFLLDAGSGAIPHKEYLEFHDGFEYRVCVDFAMAALKESKKKLGDRGRYIRADLVNLPFRSGTIDGVVCCHALYHVQAEDQLAALLEQARVLTPTGRAAIIYQWPQSSLNWRLSRVFRLLAGSSSASDSNMYPARAQDNAEQPDPLYFHAHPHQYFFDAKLPCRVDVSCFRLVDNPTMKRFFRDSFRWRIVVQGLLLWQRLMPKYTGRYGAYPVLTVYPIKE